MAEKLISFLFAQGYAGEHVNFVRRLHSQPEPERLDVFDTSVIPHHSSVERPGFFEDTPAVNLNAVWKGKNFEASRIEGFLTDLVEKEPSLFPSGVPHEYIIDHLLISSNEQKTDYDPLRALLAVREFRGEVRLTYTFLKRPYVKKDGKHRLSDPVELLERPKTDRYLLSQSILRVFRERPDTVLL